MNFYFSGYSSPYSIFSVALTEEVAVDIASKGQCYLLIDGLNTITQNGCFELSDRERLSVQSFQNYDVIELDSDGFGHSLYQDSSHDNVLFITSICNSNCIMCPSSDLSRKSGTLPDPKRLLSIIDYIPQSARHITITGGEPFMIREGIWRVLDRFKQKLPTTHFLLLTNGRAFSIENFANRFVEYMPAHTVVAIPIHGNTPNLHDSITRTPGSFGQTLVGLNRLLDLDVQVELRIVINAINIEHISDIARLIIAKFNTVSYVNFIAMEMLGNAALNATNLWIPYTESIKRMQEAIDLLVQNSIDVRLYNYPLCTVPFQYRGICQKSISDHKVAFGTSCDNCSSKVLCGGVFSSSLKYVRNELMPILE